MTEAPATAQSLDQFRDIFFQDNLSIADYRNFVAPRLRSGEISFYVASWDPYLYILVVLLGIIFFGSGTWSFYWNYFVFDTVQAACGNSNLRSCAKVYYRSSVVVPLGVLLTAVCMFTMFVTLFGWHRELYAITNQRIISCRIGFPSGFDAFELSEVTYRLGRFGITIKKRALGLSFRLGSSKAKTAEGFLALAMQRLPR